VIREVGRKGWLVSRTTVTFSGRDVVTKAGSPTGIRVGHMLILDGEQDISEKNTYLEFLRCRTIKLNEYIHTCYPDLLLLFVFSCFAQAAYL
jgi:hypothetical protein